MSGKLLEKPCFELAAKGVFRLEKCYILCHGVPGFWAATGKARLFFSMFTLKHIVAIRPNVRFHLYILRFFVVVGMTHISNGFHDLLSNELTTPELTIADSGRLLILSLYNEASTDARLDVYISNSLGHHLPGRIFSSVLPLTVEQEKEQVSSPLLTFRRPTMQNLGKPTDLSSNIFINADAAWYAIFAVNTPRVIKI